MNDLFKLFDRLREALLCKKRESRILSRPAAET